MVTHHREILQHQVYYNKFDQSKVLLTARYMVIRLSLCLSYKEHKIVLLSNIFSGKCLSLNLCDVMSSYRFYINFLVHGVDKKPMPDDFNAMDQIHTVNQIDREFKLFVSNALFLYPLKTSENLKVFSGGREKVHWEQIS